jgi:hypothetical protein
LQWPEFFAHKELGYGFRFHFDTFVLVNFFTITGGGGLSSIKIDRQGKSYAQLLLSMRIPVPAEFDQVVSKL